jgi:hypothetical protein
MSHTDFIIAISILTFIAIPVGGITVIKTIKRFTRPPVNTLQTRGDIELVDYIEPTHPGQIYQYPDLGEGQPFP